MILCTLTLNWGKLFSLSIWSAYGASSFWQKPFTISLSCKEHKFAINTDELFQNPSLLRFLVDIIPRPRADHWPNAKLNTDMYRIIIVYLLDYYVAPSDFLAGCYALQFSVSHIIYTRIKPFTYFLLPYMQSTSQTTSLL